jgi:hypothetical protein
MAEEKPVIKKISTISLKKSKFLATLAYKTKK